MRRDLRRGFSVTLPGIKTTTVKGHTYHYRRTAKGLVRLPEPSDPGFLAAYEAAEKGPAPKPGQQREAGSVAALCELLRRSEEWTEDTKPSTRRSWSLILAKIEDTRGKAPVKGIEPKHIYADLKGMPPAASNNRRKIWRMLMRLAVKEGQIASNPALQVERRKEAAVQHAPWPPEAVEQYREWWPIGSPERLAFELIYWTGARCVDARTLSRQMVDKKGWLCYVQEKTGGKVAIPLLCPLPDWCPSFEPDQAMLIACIADRIGPAFITTSFGEPRSQKGISQWMAQNAREAGLKGLTAHGLRASRAIELYLIDASTKKIGAWTGHLSLRRWSTTPETPTVADCWRVDEMGNHWQTVRKTER